MSKPLILKILDRLKTAENQIQNKQDTISETEWANMVLKNDWENYGGYFEVASYKKIGNLVFLRGFLKNGTSGTEIALLPSRFQTVENACFFSNDI